MKALRNLLVILLILVTPLRGVMAALPLLAHAENITVCCEGESVDMGHIGHHTKSHDGGAENHQASSQCHMSAGACCAAAINVENHVVHAAPMSGMLRFDDIQLGFMHFTQEGPERPPRY